MKFIDPLPGALYCADLSLAEGGEDESHTRRPQAAIAMPP
jgi:hypothetical protein